MRIYWPIRARRRSPPLSAAPAQAADLAQAVRMLIENQSAILNDLAQIKAALPFIACAPFETAQITAPNPQASSLIFSMAVSVTNQVAALLSE